MEQQLEVAILAGENDNNIELLLLHQIIGENNEIHEPGNLGQFNLENMTNVDVKTKFRFAREDIIRLKNVLGIPERIITNTRNNVDGTTALCILLRRLSYPNRLVDLSKEFKCSPQSLSQIIQATALFVVENHGHLLENLEAHQWLNRNKFQQYSQAVLNKGGAIHNCWGFIDGTVRAICRPSVNQEEYYSGHKRVHCVKYQSVLCPDGIIINLKGCYPGRRHDAGIMRDSNLYNQLEQTAVFAEEHFVLYGDQAYGVRELLLSPYPGHPDNLLPHQVVFNNSMKVLRVAVEWGFQKVLSLFAFVDFKKNQKLLLNDVEMMYKCAVIMTNCHTTLYGSQTSHYFNCEPPVLENYISQ